MVRRFLIPAAFVCVWLALVGLDCNDEEGLRPIPFEPVRDFFTLRFGPSSPMEPTYYYYVPWDHISSFSPPPDTTTPCGLYGYDIDGGRVQRENAADSTIVDDSVEHPDDNTYFQYPAFESGQRCGVLPFGDGRFQFQGVYFFLFGPIERGFPNAQTIQPAADPEADVYWTGQWEVEGSNPPVGGDFDFWPYRYDEGHPPPAGAARGPLLGEISGLGSGHSKLAEE
jgi:hypothetical protein